LICSARIEHYLLNSSLLLLLLGGKLLCATYHENKIYQVKNLSKNSWSLADLLLHKLSRVVIEVKGVFSILINKKGCYKRLFLMKNRVVQSLEGGQ